MPEIDENGDIVVTQEERDWENEHEREKLQQDPNTPTRSELASLEMQRQKKEMVFDQNAKQGIYEDVELGNEESNFGAVAEIKKTAVRVGVAIGFVLLAVLV